MLTRLTGQGVQVNKAIVGRNAFAHEAGIHQDGMLKDRRTYEIMRAEDVGAPWNPLVLGKHSGRHAVQRAAPTSGFELEGDELIEVYRALMAIADDRKTLTDDDVRAVDRTDPQRPGHGRRTTSSIRSTRRRRRARLACTKRATDTACSQSADVSVGSALRPAIVARRFRRPLDDHRAASARGCRAREAARAIRFRSSRPTSHCFCGTVLIRAFTTSWSGSNASMP